MSINGNDSQEFLLGNLIISFGKTLEPLLQGKKSVTRRLWKDLHAAKILAAWDNWQLIRAFDKDPRYKGKQVGWLRLTQEPYKEPILRMPHTDLELEGGMCQTVGEFVDKYFDGDNFAEVWVIRFQFLPMFCAIKTSVSISPTKPSTTPDNAVAVPNFEELSVELTADKQVTPRFKQYLIGYLKEAYGVERSLLTPDIKCFVNSQANIYSHQGKSEINNICGAIQLAPGRTGKREGKPCTITKTPDCGNVNFAQTELLYDSCAFTDVLTGDRITPEAALRRQLDTLRGLPTIPPEVWLVSYDRLIDEKHIAGSRIKERWSVEDGELAIVQTVEAAQYLNSQRHRLDGYKLVMSCQGVDAPQYQRCVERVLEVCQPNDVLGLGGWCILGKQKRWLPVFWEVCDRVIPIIAQAGLKQIHIFGCTWYKSMKGFPEPPLIRLLRACDEHGLNLSVDSRSPIGNALWKDTWKQAGATFPYWRHNLAWVKAELATLRDSAEYQFLQSQATSTLCQQQDTSSLGPAETPKEQLTPGTPRCMPCSTNQGKNNSGQQLSTGSDSPESISSNKISAPSQTSLFPVFPSQTALSLPFLVQTFPLLGNVPDFLAIADACFLKDSDFCDFKSLRSSSLKTLMDSLARTKVLPSRRSLNRLDSWGIALPGKSVTATDTSPKIENESSLWVFTGRVEAQAPKLHKKSLRECLEVLGAPVNSFTGAPLDEIFTLKASSYKQGVGNAAHPNVFVQFPIPVRGRPDKGFYETDEAPTLHGTEWAFGLDVKRSQNGRGAGFAILKPLAIKADASSCEIVNEAPTLVSGNWLNSTQVSHDKSGKGFAVVYRAPRGDRIHTENAPTLRSLSNIKGHQAGSGAMKVREIDGEEYWERPMTAREYENCMGWEPNCTEMGVTADGREIPISPTQRKRMCGNGVIPHEITEILENLKPFIEERTMSTETEASIVDSHVGSLFQAQIQEHQRLAEHYRELAAKREALVAALIAIQEQTDSELMALKSLVDKCKAVAPSTLASLKSAVLDLFDPGNHGGNEPIEPTPDNGSTPGIDPEADDFDIIVLNGESGDCLTTDDLDDIDDAGTTKLMTYTQAIKRRCSACWGYEVTSKADIESGFINRTDIGFMGAVGLERTGKEFYETVEAYLDKLYYNGQVCEFASIPELDRPLVAGDRFWFGGKENTGTVLTPLWEPRWADEYLCQIDDAVGEVKLERSRLHYIPSCLEGQACDIDKAPLLGQHCSITFSITEENESENADDDEAVVLLFVEVSDKVGYIKDAQSEEIKAIYAGFTRKDRAKAWGEMLAVTYSIATGYDVRPAKHLPFKWELKLWDMSLSQIQKFAAEDLTKSPRVEVNSAKPPAREPVVLDEDKVKPGQRIKTTEGVELTITSASVALQGNFWASDADGKRHLLELGDVSEFLDDDFAQRQFEASTEVQEAALQEPIVLGALVRMNSHPLEYGLVQDINSTEAEVWFEQNGTSKALPIDDLTLVATEPNYAKILDLQSEWVGQTFVVVKKSSEKTGYALLTPKGVIWHRYDTVEILDHEIEAIGLPTQPEKVVTQSVDATPVLQERASILESGDVVEIVGDRHVRHFGLIGTVVSLNHASDLPIAVRSPQGTKNYLRSDLKFLAKAGTPAATMATTVGDDAPDF